MLEEDGGTIEADYTTPPEPSGNALSQHRSGDSSFYLWDGIRNVRQLTDGAEVVTDSYGFDGWGRSTGSSGSTANTQQWQGQSIAYRKDADAGPESQYAMHHRNYNPRSGVFTAADPAKDDLNLYRYVHNNPVNNTDPAGLRDGFQPQGPPTPPYLVQPGRPYIAIDPVSGRIVYVRPEIETGGFVLRPDGSGGPPELGETSPERIPIPSKLVPHLPPTSDESSILQSKCDVAKVEQYDPSIAELLEADAKRTELRRLGDVLQDLITKINDAEQTRRKWVVRSYSLNPRSAWMPGPSIRSWSVEYGSMELPEKVWRQELEFLMVRIVQAELAAGITLEKLQNQPTLVAPDRSCWGDWINTPGHSESLDMLGKPVGRAATDMAVGLWSLITDFPGVVDGLNETMKDVAEDPVGFYERTSEAIHRRAEQLTPAGAEIEVGYQQLLLEIASGELLSLGAGKLTKAGITRALEKLRTRSEVLTAVRLLKNKGTVSGR